MITALLVVATLANLYAAHRNMRTARKHNVIGNALKRAYADLGRERLALARREAFITGTGVVRFPFGH